MPKFKETHKASDTNSHWVLYIVVSSTLLTSQILPNSNHITSNWSVCILEQAQNYNIDLRLHVLHCNRVFFRITQLQHAKLMMS